MKRTVTMLLLFGVLAGAVGLAAPAPVWAQANAPVLEAFSGEFQIDNGGVMQTISVSGWVHAKVVLSAYPTDPTRIHTNLVNVRAINTTTGGTYVGVGSAVTGVVIGDNPPFVALYHLQGARLYPVDASRLLILTLHYDVTVGADGSLTFDSPISVSGGSLPE